MTTNRRAGISILLVLMALATFALFFPLLFQQLDTGFKRAQMLDRWSRIQEAGDLGLKLAMQIPQDQSLAGVASVATLTYWPADFTLRVRYSRPEEFVVVASVTSWLGDTDHGYASMGFDMHHFRGRFKVDTSPSSLKGEIVFTEWQAWTTPN